MDIKKLVNNKDTTIVDVRTIGEFTSGNIEGSINIPLDQIVQKVDDLKEMEPVVLCCLSGGRSGQATRYLKSMGCEQVYNGGGWKEVLDMIEE